MKSESATPGPPGSTSDTWQGSPGAVHVYVEASAYVSGWVATPSSEKEQNSGMGSYSAHCPEGSPFEKAASVLQRRGSWRLPTTGLRTCNRRVERHRFRIRPL